MTRPVRLSGLAALDLQQARDWFDGQEDGQGDKFLTSVEQTLDRISKDAEQYRRATRSASSADSAVPIFTLVPGRYTQYSAGHAKEFVQAVYDEFGKN